MAVGVLPPGPRLPYPVLMAAWLARPWRFMDWCARRYGDMFTLGPNAPVPLVMVSHPDVVKEVFTGPSRILHAGAGNRILRPVVGANSVLVLDDDAHREQRKLLMPPFRGHHLTAYADTMATVAKAEIAGWPRGTPIRLHPRMQALTLEIILRSVFGLSEGPRLEQLRAALAKALMSPLSRVGYAVLTLGSDRFQKRAIGNLLRNVDRLLYAEIAERRNGERLDERGDVLSVLLQAGHDDGTPMSDVEILDELITLLAAGHETTAAALAWAVERIARDPDCQARLILETRSGETEFVDAVIRETLRLRPVLSNVVRQLTEPLEIGGVTLPAGVAVSPSIYLMHRRPDVYPDPTRFRPERFLENKPGTYTWIPFGGGVRRCLGATFAEHEMRVVLTTLFENSTVLPAKARPERAGRRGVTHVPGRGATVVLG